MKLCRKLQYPKKQLSYGKSLVLLKSQLHFNQYIKKRVCSGIKLYKLTLSNGKTLSFSVKAGKGCSIMGMRIVTWQHRKERSLTGNT